MEIRIFQSFKGDCLLIKSRSGHYVLCDGGTPAAMRKFIAEQLERLHDNGDAIDLVYVSHIDQDHVGGVLSLLEAQLEWKIYDLLHGEKDPPTPPRSPRVPKIRGIWHNAFRDLITKNAGAIEELLAASAPALQASHVPDMVNLGREYAEIATSIPEAMRVSRLIKSDLLDIPLNKRSSSPSSSGRLLMARGDGTTETLGSMKITILCPTPKELDDLRNGWNEWLRDLKNRRTAHAIRDRYASALAQPNGATQDNPLDLRNWNGVTDYEGVTAPNVASLVLLIEEDGKRVLLTGDSHPDKILAGLEGVGLLDDGYMHVNVLKFPHHGSEHNMTTEFGRKVSADHYVFCGNGEHTNPEISVLKQVLSSRVGSGPRRALAPEAARPFKFWFSTAANSQTNSAAAEQMRKVENWASEMARAYQRQFRAQFVSKAFGALTV